MADLQNTQFYDWNGTDTPKSPKWWQSKRVQMIGAIAIGVILLALIVVGIYVRQMDSSTAQVQEEADGMITRDAGECETAIDKDACLASLRTRTARSLGAVAVCEGLIEQSYLNCVTLIAQEQQNLTACNALQNSEKQSCLDSVNLLLATEKQDYGICKDISDDDLRFSCEQLTLQSVIAQNACNTHGIDASICDDGKNLNDILERGTIRDCANLALESTRENCEEIFSVKDSDNDGLSDADEVLIHETDPRNADSDGDGYSDGEEVEAGFNPRG